MSGFVYLIKLADGRNVKLQIEDYYSPNVQEQCDSTGMIPTSNTGSGNIIARWAFVP